MTIQYFNKFDELAYSYKKISYLDNDHRIAGLLSDLGSGFNYRNLHKLYRLKSFRIFSTNIKLTLQFRPRFYLKGKKKLKYRIGLNPFRKVRIFIDLNTWETEYLQSRFSPYVYRNFSLISRSYYKGQPLLCSTFEMLFDYLEKLFENPYIQMELLKSDPNLKSYEDPVSLYHQNSKSFLLEKLENLEKFPWKYLTNESSVLRILAKNFIENHNYSKV